MCVALVNENRDAKCHMIFILCDRKDSDAVQIVNNNNSIAYVLCDTLWH